MVVQGENYIALKVAREGLYFRGSFIDSLGWDEAIARVVEWGEERQSRYVCICNVHSVITASSDHRLKDAINGSDLATPDGMPLAWQMRRKGFPAQQRISGPDMMLRLCHIAEKKKIKIFLYGSTKNTLDNLQNNLMEIFPDLVISGAYSPPFRPLTASENEEVVQLINGSGAGILFVGLGCPRQEIWMHSQKGKINAVMVGVGAAFDFHAGLIQRAPVFLRKAGLEWLHRLLSEPRRLFKRYLFTNSKFIYHFLKGDLN